MVVRGGDTLSRIGQRHRPEGVSLDQMLAALYRENPNAFLGSNINLLKAGAAIFFGLLAAFASRPQRTGSFDADGERLTLHLIDAGLRLRLGAQLLNIASQCDTARRDNTYGAIVQHFSVERGGRGKGHRVS